jgi:hypothetical protein
MKLDKPVKNLIQNTRNTPVTLSFDQITLFKIDDNTRAQFEPQLFS